MHKVNLADKFSLIDDLWSPRLAGELNNQAVKIARIKGQFIWHTHENEDEFFLVVKGSMTIKLREGDIHLKEGEFFIVPRGVEHKPIAENEAHILMFEPIGTLNTGNIRSDQSVDNVEPI